MGLHVVSGFTHVEAQAAFTAAQSDTDPLVQIKFPAGTHVWSPSATLTFDVPGTFPDVDIFGEGIDSTFIQDNWSSGSPLISFTSIYRKFRLRDFTLSLGASFAYKNDWMLFSGVTGNFRITRIKCYANQNVGKVFRTNGWIFGVIDHLDFQNAGWCQICHIDYTYPDGYGDTYWSQATQKGLSQCMFVEDCKQYSVTDPTINVFLNDSDHGSSVVMRFNDIKSSSFQNHATIRLRSRGSRHIEFYCNKVRDDHVTPYFNMGFHTNGTLYCWNNPIQSGYLNAFTFHANRRTNLAYGNSNTPGGWGFAGKNAQNFYYGNVNTAGTVVTKTSGNNWYGGTGTQAWGLEAGALININGTVYTVASLDSTTQVTLTTSAGTQTGVPAYIVCNWDGQTDDYGYPNMDQPGRGQGNLLSGDFPSCVNVDQGNIGHTNPNAHPHQALEPIYIWLTPWTNPGGGGSYIGNYNGEVIQEDRDYYLEKASFTGASGIGIGSFATMSAITPSHTGVGFWVTDRGSWNAGTNPFYTGQGQLFVWNGSAWVKDYEPYTYPHPLITADGDSGGGPTPPTPTPTTTILMGACLN